MPPVRKLRAVIYARVSVDRAKGASVDRQIKGGRRVVALNEWDLVAVFSDNDKSGSKPGVDRPDWQRLWADLEAGLFDVLVLWEPSRATRDRVVYAALMQACIEHGVLICGNGKTLDPRKAAEALILDVFFAVAIHESARTAERVSETADIRAGAGMPGPGKAPFGYRRLYDGSTHRVASQVFDDIERTSTGMDGAVSLWTPAELVRSLFAESAQGATTYSLATELMERGIPNPRTLNAIERHPDREREYGERWNDSMIGRLFANTAYIGQRTYRGALTAEGCWPKLIDEETFYEVNNAFAARKARVPRTRPQAARQLMTKLAICMECEASIHSAGVESYRCPPGRTWIRVDELDRYVITHLLAWLAVPANIAKIQALEGSAVEIGEALAEAGRLRKELADWKRDATKGLVDREDYTGRRAELLPQIEAAERRAVTSGIPNVVRRFIGADPVLVWEELLLPARRELVGYLLEVRVRGAGRGRRNVPIGERVTITPRIK